MFSKAYDTFFPEIQKRIKTESFQSPWITEDIQISKRVVQKERIVCKEMDLCLWKNYKHCKNLFGKLRNISNKLIAKWIFEIWELGKTHLEYKLKSNQQKESHISFSQ